MKTPPLAYICDLNANPSKNVTSEQASEGVLLRHVETISWCHLVAAFHHCITARLPGALSPGRAIALLSHCPQKEKLPQHPARSATIIRFCTLRPGPALCLCLTQVTTHRWDAQSPALVSRCCLLPR